MKPQFRELRRTVYTLKRRYPQAITLCRTTNNVANVETGRMTETLVKVNILRAVIMPAKEARAFNYSRGFVAADRNFTYGGFFDHQLRKILIDRRDIPSSFTVDMNMHLVFEQKRYEVKGLEEYEEAECILVTVDWLAGSPLKDQNDQSISDTLVPGQDIETS